MMGFLNLESQFESDSDSDDEVHSKSSGSECGEPKSWWIVAGACLYLSLLIFFHYNYLQTGRLDDLSNMADKTEIMLENVHIDELALKANIDEAYLQLNDNSMFVHLLENDTMLVDSLQQEMQRYN